MSPYIGLSQIVDGNQGCQLSPETWTAVQEELRDLLEGGQIIIEKGGLDPFSTKRKKQPKGVPGRIEGTHMRVYGTADVLDQVEQTLQRANIPGLRVGRSKHRSSDHVAHRITNM